MLKKDFLVFACSNKHRYTPLLILHKIIKNRGKNQFEFFKNKSLKNHNAKTICYREFYLAPNERELSNLLTLLISLEATFSQMKPTAFSKGNENHVSLEYVKK